MHFVTFVAIELGDYPISKETDELIKAKIAELSKIKAESIGDNIFLKCRISELRALTNSFARAVNAATEQKLAPYCECTDNEEYLEFFDQTEEVRKQFEEDCDDCIKLRNGQIVPVYELHGKFCIKNGLVYEKNWGPLKHDKRTKKAKRMIALPQYPLKKVYKTFEKYAEEYLCLRFDEEKNAYGYYCNPNSFWDWYQIGGRWPCNFLVKADCEEYALGEFDDDDNMPTAPEGYKWASAARKKDIEWQVLIEHEKKCMAERFEKYRNAFAKKERTEDMWYLRLADDGIYEGNHAVYLAGETFEENQIRRNFICDSDYLTLPCYYVDNDTWHSEDGWWGNPRETASWIEELKKFYDSLSDETVLVSVDCHE